jgi:hypothetical protein
MARNHCYVCHVTDYLSCFWVFNLLWMDYNGVWRLSSLKSTKASGGLLSWGNKGPLIIPSRSVSVICCWPIPLSWWADMPRDTTRDNLICYGCQSVIHPVLTGSFCLWDSTNTEWNHRHWPVRVIRYGSGNFHMTHPIGREHKVGH